MSDLTLVSASRRLAQSLKPGDLLSTLESITRAAVDVLDVAGASISMLHDDGRMESFAQTDKTILEVDRIQATLQEGPCYTAAADGRTVLAPHIAEDDRFPRYAPEVVSHGIEAQAGLPVFETTHIQGALNLYSRDPSAFEELSALEELFASQATMVVAYAQELAGLQEAIRTRQLIGQAVGMIMERYHLSAEHAFAFLSRLSQQRNVKVRDLAQEFLDS